MIKGGKLDDTIGNEEDGDEAQFRNSMYNMAPVHAPGPSSISSELRQNFRNKSDNGQPVRSELPKTLNESQVSNERSAQNEHISIRVDLPLANREGEHRGGSNGHSHNSSGYIRINEETNNQ